MGLQTEREKAAATARVPDKRLRYAKLFIAVSLVAAYLPHLTSRLWIDEAGTYWMAHAGPLTAIQKAWLFPGQSTLFAVISSFFCFDGTPLRDAILRIPSLASAAAASYFLYRFAEDAIGKGAGRVAAVLFLFFPATIDFATQARVYMAAMAAAAASCWTLFRWTERGERAWLAGYVASIVTVFYFQYMFSLILLTHAAILGCAIVRKRRHLPLRELAAGCGAAILLSVPTVPGFLRVLHAAPTFGTVIRPSTSDLLAILIPPYYFVAGVLLAGLVVYLVWRDRPRPFASIPRDSVAVLAVWWLAGPALLFGLSAAAGIQVLYARYSLYSGMAFVLILVGAGYFLLGPKGSFALALLSILTTGAPLRLAGLGKPRPQELAPVMRAITAESTGEGVAPPVLARSQYVESNFGNWQEGNVPDSYYFSAYVAYPVGNRIVPLPCGLTKPVKAHVMELIRGTLRDQRKVIFVSEDESWIPWMEEQFRRARFRVRWVRPNNYYVGVFERPNTRD